MDKKDSEKLRILDLERGQNFRRRSEPVNFENTQKTITERILEIIKKIDVSPRILVINCTWFDNLILKDKLVVQVI